MSTPGFELVEGKTARERTGRRPHMQKAKKRVAANAPRCYGPSAYAIPVSIGVYLT